MKGSKNIVLIVIGVLVVIALLLFFGNNGKRYDWSTNKLNYESREPYGLSVLNQTLKLKYKKFHSYDKNTIANLYRFKEPTDYIAIGVYLNYKRKEVDSLYNFIAKGNNAFLAFDNMSDTVLMRFGIPEESRTFIPHTKTKASFNFFHPKLAKKTNIAVDIREHFNKKTSFSWSYQEPYYHYEQDINSAATVVDGIDENETVNEEYQYNDSLYYEDEYTTDNGDYNFDEYYYGDDFLAGVKPVSQLYDIAYLDTKKQVLCRKYKIENGALYVMQNPILLSNFFFTNDTLMDIPVGLLSHLDAENCILDIEAASFKLGSFTANTKNTPLRYMLSKVWFKRSIYSLLVLALLFIVVSSFRKQRPNEVYTAPQNKSIDLIKNIAAALYHTEDLAKIKNYLTASFDFWRMQQGRNLDFLNPEDKIRLDRCAFLSRRELLSLQEINEFETTFFQLKTIYGNA